MTGTLLYLAAGLLKSDNINLPQAPATTSTLTTALNVVFATVGAIAFLFFVIGGFRYVLSQGDPNKVADSKRMITYSVAGLLVMALAATIVNFVLGKL